MNKKVGFSLLVLLLLSLLLSGSNIEQHSRGYLSTVYDLIDVKNIKKIEIRHSGPDGIKKVTNKSNKKILLGYLKTLKCKKSVDQGDRNGWSYFIDFYYIHGKKDRITFQGKKMLFNDTRYDLSKDIRKKIKVYFDSLPQ